MKDKDLLTGLLGAESLRRQLSEQIKAGDSIALAWIDVDAFDNINTDFGSAVGDHVLETLARVLGDSALENSGEAYRVGGDAFAIRLPSLTLEQAFLRMERLRATVQGSTESFNLPDKREVTLSIGVAQYPRDGKDTAELIKAADAAMMSAKEQSPNTVGLPPNEEMVLKSCYYPAGAVRKLRSLAEKKGRKESSLLREALTDFLQKS